MTPPTLSAPKSSEAKMMPMGLALASIAIPMPSAPMPGLKPCTSMCCTPFVLCEARDRGERTSDEEGRHVDTARAYAGEPCRVSVESNDADAITELSPIEDEPYRDSDEHGEDEAYMEARAAEDKRQPEALVEGVGLGVFVLCLHEGSARK